MCKCRNDQLDELIGTNQGKHGALIPVLQGAQRIMGYLSHDTMRAISRGLKVPLAQVYGTATFYSQFKFAPTGEHTISVCMGTACYVRGAERTLGRISELIETPAGKTSGDGKFNLEVTRCVGACGLAPVVTVDTDVHSNIKIDQVRELIEKYR